MSTAWFGPASDNKKFYDPSSMGDVTFGNSWASCILLIFNALSNVAYM